MGLLSRATRSRADYPLLQDFRATYKYFENEKSTGPTTRVARIFLLLLGPIGLGFAAGFSAAGIL